MKNLTWFGKILFLLIIGASIYLSSVRVPSNGREVTTLKEGFAIAFIVLATIVGIVVYACASDALILDYNDHPILYMVISYIAAGLGIWGSWFVQDPYAISLILLLLGSVVSVISTITLVQEILYGDIDIIEDIKRLIFKDY